MTRNNKQNATALKIRTTATEMFAEKGYDGTIMDELTVRSGVNKASIYYHFQDKSNLYEQCLTHLFANVADAVINATELATPGTPKLKAFVKTFAKLANATPAMPAILMREIASGGHNMPVTARHQMQRLLSTLKFILDTEDPNPNFEPINALTPHFMIIGSLCFYLTSQPMRDRIESTEKIDPTLEEFTQQLIDILQSGLIKKTKGGLT
ncbi:TetR/AcrR family transcriptional regulator [Hydrogenovibrio sp. 3SP14C1]|uniref:TetR/AcrR family transcriptional regulator n=1 Tax=Hydrogenovibrio sp. 3SP14C1 TaxID=3038774 RepID=UPI0024167D06|nr:TetR/AcrR family transcriptional regulator [Hydrogenovibrio sp. 3SP14C1]MDG4812619.1 TetR/AcrR family transcriptional regulator [Hydrogenovibrio sp. 3SP14C1]